jgi:hypothetical protein
MRDSVTYLLLGFAIFFAGNSQAVPVDVEFKGTVTTYFVDPANTDPFGGSILSGTSFLGHYLYDSAATPNPNPAPTNGIASYTSTGLAYGMNVNIGGTPFAIDGSLNVGVANNISGGVDQYTVFAEKGIAGGLNDYLTLQLFLQDSTGTVFNNTGLVPLTSTNVQSFDVKSFFLDGVQTINGKTYQFQVQGNINGIPEPTTVTLLGAGLLGWVTACRRKAKT